MTSFIDSKKNEIIQAIGDELVEDIRSEMDKAGINASGRLSDSLEAVVTYDGLQIWANDYFEFAEKGRPAGRVPYGFSDILAKWVEDKHISVPDKYRDTKQFGWAISQTIKNYGSKRYRTGTAVDVLSEPAEKAANRLADRLGDLWYSVLE